MSTTSANAPSSAAQAHRLAALVFTDIVNSTELKSRYRADYLPLLERHNQLFEDGIRESPSAEIIKHTGDGYFAAFATASDAVQFALLFQARMCVEPWQPEKIQARLGIHIGEVVFVEMASRKDIVGLSADIAARLMDLAVGGQILLTETAFNDARQYVNHIPEILGKKPPLKWMAHGRYLFKGTDDPLEVFEVGVENTFPLRQPADSPKVKRVVPHDQEPTLGWRPAVGLAVPERPGWNLARKLGEGGFGEVWLAEHQKLKELRVFKFCFDVERLRSLKREYMLFRLLREALGSRTDIAALYEVKLDEPPFFLESEYTAGGNFLEWAESKGGIKALALETRLELLAKVADALAAAHSVGVLHKDLKPANILIHEASDGKIYPRLADFGIGALADRSHLKAHNVTEGGYTEFTTDSAGSNSTGTRMYAPPESMRDTPFTMRGDIYALGVILYQLAIGDLLHPLATGWERDISDEIMRSDIAAIVEGDPERRTPTADAVARLLRSQDTRRAELQKSRKDVAAIQHRRKARRFAAAVAAAVFATLVGGVAVSLWYARRLDRERNKAVAVTKTLVDVIKDADPETSGSGIPTAEKLILDISKRFDETFKEDSQFSADIHLSIAEALRNFGDSQAVGDYEEAARINRQLHGDLDPRTLRADFGRGYAQFKLDNFREAQATLKDVLHKQTKVLGPLDRETLQTALLYAATVNNLSGPTAAEPLYKSALDTYRQKFGDDDKDTIISITTFASIERDLGRLDDAEKLARESRDWHVKRFGPYGFGSLRAQSTYGAILVDLGRATEAAPILRSVLDRRTEIAGPMKPEARHAMALYADALSATHNYSEAEKLYDQVVRGLRGRDKLTGLAQREAMTTLTNFADLLTSVGRNVDATLKAREAYDYFNNNPLAGPRLVLRARYVYARTLEAASKLEAGRIYSEVAADATNSFGPDSLFTKQYAKANADYIARHSPTTRTRQSAQSSR